LGKEASNEAVEEDNRTNMITVGSTQKNLPILHQNKQPLTASLHSKPALRGERKI